MSAPTPDKIILPSDTANAGKKVRTQARVVGPDTVHEHFFVPTSARSKLGSYKASTGPIVVPSAAQNGTTSGLWWLSVPIGGAGKIAVRRVEIISQFVAVGVDLLAGDIRLSAFTFAGVGTAGLVTPAKRNASDAPADGQLRTASTGMVVTLVATHSSLLLQTQDLAAGGAGHWNPSYYEWVTQEEDEQVVLVAGEGIVCWNASSVTTANRRLTTNIGWEEFE